MTAGGKRKGAGRKPRSAPLVGLTLRITPELWTAWQDRKERLAISGPALLAKLLGVRSRKTVPRKSNDQIHP
jgi:hypothetical protein